MSALVEELKVSRWVIFEDSNCSVLRLTLLVIWFCLKTVILFAVQTYLYSRISIFSGFCMRIYKECHIYYCFCNLLFYYVCQKWPKKQAKFLKKSFYSDRCVHILIHYPYWYFKKWNPPIVKVIRFLLLKAFWDWLELHCRWRIF